MCAVVTHPQSSSLLKSDLPLKLLLGLALVQMSVWTFGPAVLLHNLHQDTIEILYWSRELALGYPKHPPLAPVLVRLFMVAGSAGVFSLMVLSQIGFIIAALYCASLRSVLKTSSAQIFVFCAMIIAPMSGVFGVQINHNSLLMPFWAACLYYGFNYLEYGRWRDAIGLSIAAACGAWLKYEIAFVLIGLLGVSLLWAPYRHIWKRAASYICVGLFVLLFARHLWWLFHVDGSPVSYALETQSNESATLLNRLNNFFVGFVICILAAVIMLAILRLNRVRLQWATFKSPALISCGLSLAALVIMSLVTHQGIRQGWLIPFTPSVILAFVSVVRLDDDLIKPYWQIMIKSCMALTALICVGFAGFVIMRAQSDKPIASYSFDGAHLNQVVEEQWAATHFGTLSCLIVNDHYVAAAPLLWLYDHIRVVDFSVPYWSRPQQIAYCNRHGGVILDVLNGPKIDYAQYFPLMCHGQHQTHIGARFGKKDLWAFNVMIVPPEGQTCP